MYRKFFNCSTIFKVNGTKKNIYFTLLVGIGLNMFRQYRLYEDIRHCFIG